MKIPIMYNVRSVLQRPASTAFTALGIGLVVAVIVLIIGKPTFDQAFWAGLFRWLHVFTGVLWIGLLYYFNFVQMPTMPKIPAEQRPAVSKFIAPEALFWFRFPGYGLSLTSVTSVPPKKRPGGVRPTA